MGCVICRMRATPERAQEYAETIRRQYLGCKIEVTDGECGGVTMPLPTNSALWPLTVK